MPHHKLLHARDLGTPSASDNSRQEHLGSASMFLPHLEGMKREPLPGSRKGAGLATHPAVRPIYYLTLACALQEGPFKRQGPCGATHSGRPVMQ